MTTQPYFDHYDDHAFAAAPSAPSHPSALQLPPVRPRPARVVGTGPLFATLGEYVDLTHRLRAAALRS